MAVQAFKAMHASPVQGWMLGPATTSPAWLRSGDVRRAQALVVSCVLSAQISLGVSCKCCAWFAASLVKVQFSSTLSLHGKVLRDFRFCWAMRHAMLERKSPVMLGFSGASLDMFRPSVRSARCL